MSERVAALERKACSLPGGLSSLSKSKRNVKSVRELSVKGRNAFIGELASLGGLGQDELAATLGSGIFGDDSVADGDGSNTDVASDVRGISQTAYWSSLLDAVRSPIVARSMTLFLQECDMDLHSHDLNSLCKQSTFDHVLHDDTSLRAVARFSSKAPKK